MQPTLPLALEHARKRRKRVEQDDQDDQHREQDVSVAQAKEAREWRHKLVLRRELFRVAIAGHDDGGDDDSD